MERGLVSERSMQANERVMLDYGRFTLPNDGKGTGLGFRSVQVGACVSACTDNASERESHVGVRVRPAHPTKVCRVRECSTRERSQ